jgi:hypothetical protein
MRRYVPPKRRFLQDPHGVTSQKTPFFILHMLVQRKTVISGHRERINCALLLDVSSATATATATATREQSLRNSGRVKQNFNIPRIARKNTEILFYTDRWRTWSKVKGSNVTSFCCAHIAMRSVKDAKQQQQKKQKTNSVALSPRANYTDWSTATCRRNLVSTFVDRGVSHGQCGGSLTVVNLSFLDRSRYFSFK